MSYILVYARNLSEPHLSEGTVSILSAQQLIEANYDLHKLLSLIDFMSINNTSVREMCAVFIFILGCM